MSVFGPAPRSVLGSVFPARGFSPRSLFAAGEVGAWYDPSDLTTLFQDTGGTTPVTTAGQRVALMQDKSGRGNHATQSVLAQRPTYQVDAGGRPYLEFDGIDDGMLTSTITPGADKVAVFAGVRKLSDAATGTLVEFSALWDANNGTLSIFAPLASLPASYRMNSRGTVGASAPTLGSTFAAAPDLAVISGLSDISGDSIVLRRNGAVAHTSSGEQGTGNYLAYPLYLGRRGGTTLPFNGHLYGLVLRFSAANLGAAQIAATERWMNSKTGAF